MNKWEYQNKPCYLENSVVREPCKQRTACTIQFHYKVRPLSFLMRDLQATGRVIMLSADSTWDYLTRVYPFWIQNSNAGSSVTSLSCGIIEATFDFGTWTMRCARNIANTFIDWTENKIMVFPLIFFRQMPFLQEIVNIKILDFNFVGHFQLCS